jgi:hypothetical protein
MSTDIRREFELPYDLKTVKKAICDTCATGGTAYQMKNSNEAFNSYTITIIRTLNVVTASISLADSEGKTMFILTAGLGPNLSKHPAIANGMVDGLLTQIGNFAAGKLVARPLTQEQIKKKGRSTLLTLGIAVGAIVLLVIYVFFKH